MKKAISLAIALILMLSLCACGGGNGKTESGGTSSETENSGSAYDSRPQSVIEKVSDKDYVPSDVLVGKWAKYAERDDSYVFDNQKEKWEKGTDGEFTFNADGSFSAEIWYVASPAAKRSFSGTYLIDKDPAAEKAYMLNVVLTITAQSGDESAPALPDTATDKDGLWFTFSWIGAIGEQTLCWLHNAPGSFYRKLS